MRSWGGRHSTRLVALTLATKGTTCHLCGLDGAESADHDPPRSRLIQLGVSDPDAPEFLYPAHRTCNVRRKARTITPDLLVELREARLAFLGLGPDPTAARLSPALAARRPPKSF